MMSWLTRQFGIGAKVKTAANDDVMSVVLEGSSQHLITSAHSAMEKSTWVYRAVNTVCTRIGSLPWHLYQGDKVVEGKSAVLLRPNPYQTFVEMLEQITAWQLLKGIGVSYAEPMNLRALDAEKLRTEQGALQYYENGQWKGLDPKRVVLFPNFSLSGSVGLSELSPVLDAANMDEASKRVFNNQMSAGGILSGLLSSDQPLTEDELDAVKKRWEEKYGGVDKAGSIGVAGAGFKFQQIGISAADMKMLEVSKVTKNEIGTAFGVPGIFLGDMESVDYSNALIQERILYSNTICPRADRLADRITLFLLPLLGLKGLEFRFDYSGIEALQANKLERAQIDEIQVRTGALTINEIRERDGLKKVKWGDAWWTSAMSVPVTTSEIVEPAPVLPPEAPPVNVDEGKAIQKGISTETRRIIAKSFLSTVKPQERKFASNTMKVFNAQAKLVASWVEEHEKAAPVKKLRDVLADDDFVETWHSLFVAFGKSALEDVAARYDMSVPDGSEILKWIRAQESKHSKLVNDTTADEISKILADARANGESIPDMVAKTKQYFDGIAYRAERVARTNVIAVNNASAQDVYVENGVEKHEWLATDDPVTRETHWAADGQVVGINESFIVGGEPLMYPGDPNGSPEETINCRCTLLPVI